MDVSCFCHQMNQMDLIIFFANGFHELHEFIFFLCRQMNPMNRMAGANVLSGSSGSSGDYQNNVFHER